MNKLVVMLLLTCGGTLGAAVRGPFVPLMVYYLFGLLRPQFLWEFDLKYIEVPFLGPADRVGWSLFVAVGCLLSYLPWALGVIGPRFDRERFVFPPFAWAHRFVLLFAVWCSVSYGYAYDQNQAWKFYQDLLKIFVMYLVSTQVIRAFWQVRFMYLMLTLVLGYIAYELNAEYLRNGNLVLVKKGYAGLDNNGSALMLAMGVPLCYFAWEFVRGWYRWGFLLFIPLIVHAIVSSYSRGAMLSALAVSPLYFLYTRKRKFLAVCFLGTAAILPFLAGKEIQDRFFSVQEAKTDDSFNSRLQSWEAACKIANDYPFFGIGVRCSNLVSKDYGADMEGRTIHSNYLQIAADCGWCGLIVYLAAVGCVIGSMWRARHRLWPYRDDESVRTVAALGGIECCLWTFLVGAAALSLETFEMPFLVLLMGAQVWAILNARVYAPAGVPLAAGPANQVGTTGRAVPLTVVRPAHVRPPGPAANGARAARYSPAAPTVPDFDLPPSGRRGGG